MSSKTARIAALNDLCRTAMGVAGRLVQTQGISALPSHEQSAIREKVELFDAFSEDNDPHGEHDFGALDHNGHRIFNRENDSDENTSDVLMLANPTFVINCLRLCDWRTEWIAALCKQSGVRPGEMLCL
jgi:hypothetical protein